MNMRKHISLWMVSLFAAFILATVTTTALVDYRDASYKAFSLKPAGADDEGLQVGEKCHYGLNGAGIPIMGVGLKYHGEIVCGVPGDSIREKEARRLVQATSSDIPINPPVTEPPVEEPEEPEPVCHYEEHWTYHKTRICFIDHIGQYRCQFYWGWGPQEIQVCE